MPRTQQAAFPQVQVGPGSSLPRRKRRNNGLWLIAGVAVLCVVAVAVAALVIGLSGTGPSFNPLLPPEARVADAFIRENETPSYKVLRRDGPWPIAGSAAFFKSNDTNYRRWMIDQLRNTENQWEMLTGAGRVVRIKYGHTAIANTYTVEDRVFMVRSGHVVHIVDWRDYRRPGETMDKYRDRHPGE